jgi:hypothetical protein
VLLMPPAEYLPEGEEPKVFASMIAPPGYNIAEMTRIASTLNAELAQYCWRTTRSLRARRDGDFPALASANLNLNSRAGSA